MVDIINAFRDCSLLDIFDKLSVFTLQNCLKLIDLSKFYRICTKRYKKYTAYLVAMFVPVSSLFQNQHFLGFTHGS